MNTELLFFILTSVFVIAGTTIAARVDKLVVDQIRILMKLITEEVIPDRESNWKTWGNFYALFSISVIIIIQIALTQWWYAFMWLPVQWLLWWIVHDFTTGWFILGKPLHISSDPISQWFGEICQQWGWLYLSVRLVWLFLMVMAYLMLSFNIRLG